MQRGWVGSSGYRALIDALSAVRREQGISQRELARRIGKPPSFVNKVELFERRLDLLEFIVIAKAMDWEPSGLLLHLQGNVSESLTI